MSSTPKMGTTPMVSWGMADDGDGSLLEDPEWKRKLLVAREQVINCAEGKLTSMFVKYAEDAGLNVFDNQGRSAFVRGWAKEKGLLVSVCWEAFNELRKYMPMVSFVKVYGSADSVVSTITTKYTQQAKYRDRKGGDNVIRKAGSVVGEQQQQQQPSETLQIHAGLDNVQRLAEAYNPRSAAGSAELPLQPGCTVFVTTKLQQPPRLVMEGIVKEVNWSESSVTIALKAIIQGMCTHQETLGVRQMHAGPLQKCVTLKDVVCEVQPKLDQLGEKGTLLLTVPISQTVMPTDPGKRNEVVEFQATWATSLVQWKQSLANKRAAEPSAIMSAQKAQKS
uniref:Uncharacterized protein n=1 Tax=Pyramimonas obovata TaxID=1411642 RepID=A0A7S0RMK0_9CHLO